MNPMKSLILLLLMMTIFGLGCGEDEGVIQPEQVETQPAEMQPETQPDIQPEMQPIEQPQPKGEVKEFVIEADD